jgi:predicted GH43/DUF377 family glycosyl hydrolase
MLTHAAVPTADWIGDDLFRVYFGCRDSQNRARVGFVEIDITNPKNILRISDRPLVDLGELGTFDDSGVLMSWITNVDGRKYLYYTGWNLGVTVSFRNNIGLAISDDGGDSFVRYSPAPIVDRSRYDPSFAANPCVIYDEGLWRMYYLSCFKWERVNGKPKHYYHLKYAESQNGIDWKREGIVSIEFRSDVEYAISRPSALRDNGIYKMWYSYRASEHGPTYRIGYAESSDGVAWQRKDDQVAIDVSPSGWDSEMIEYPHVFDHKGVRYMLYNGNEYGKTGFGLAVWSG